MCQDGGRCIRLRFCTTKILVLKAVWVEILSLAGKYELQDYLNRALINRLDLEKGTAYTTLKADTLYMIKLKKKKKI